MPIYVYETIPGQSQCIHCEDGFEFLQKLNEPALEACPDCGALVTRMVTAAHIAHHSPSLDDSNIGKHGFTKYRKVGKGQYEKTAGKGPKFIVDKKDS